MSTSIRPKSPRKEEKKTGVNPLHLGRQGSRRHVVTDANGVPFAVMLTAANALGSTVFEEFVDSVPPVKSKRDDSYNYRDQ